jgi:hypothetical protein
VFHHPIDWTTSARDCEWTLTAMCGVAAVGFIGYFLHEFGQKKSLLFLIVQNALMILVFSGIYLGHGLEGIKSGETFVHKTALYFSIITWTTVGYGDLTPLADIRLIAAAEALLGNISLGLAVSLTSSLMSKQHDRRVRTSP